MGSIKNRAAVGGSALREAALDIIEEGISAALPETVMQDIRFDAAQRILSFGEHEYRVAGNIFIIGGGKAAGRMAVCAERRIGPEHIAAGVVTCKDAGYDTKKIRVLEAGHPTPDWRGVNGVMEMLALKKRVGVDDLVLFLISGGGSALMPCPVFGVSLSDLQEVNNLLLSSGAPIAEINVVRKHLSRIKGGQLGAYFWPARVVSLILSDVVGNDLETIASGPTVPDSSTFKDALRIIGSYAISPPRSVMEYLEKGARGEVSETPKELPNCVNHIIGDNSRSLAAMERKAGALGYRPVIVTSSLRGDPAVAAKKLARELIAGKHDGYDAIILGGETTPKLPENPGKGGRNQHYAAVSCFALADLPGRWVLASVGSDGSDFLKDVAGGIVDDESLGRAGDDAEDLIARYDSFRFLDRVGGIIRTGPTGTNVCDLIVYLRENR